MLAPLLTTEDPYAAASEFSLAGWKLEHQTRAGRRPTASVRIARHVAAGAGHSG